MYTGKYFRVIGEIEENLQNLGMVVEPDNSGDYNGDSSRFNLLYEGSLYACLLFSSSVGTLNDYTPTLEQGVSLPSSVPTVVSKALERDNFHFEFKSRGGN